jgi:hypothetical protein
MNHWMTWCAAVGAMFTIALAARPSAAQGPAGPLIRQTDFTAYQAFEEGMEVAGTQRTPGCEGVALYDTALIEDDGVGGGGGFPKWTNADELSPLAEVNASRQIKKVLVVDRPEATEAVLYVRPGKAEMLFNGTPVKRSGDSRFWKVPPELVKKGENTVVLRADGDAGAEIKLLTRKQILENAPELKDRAPRSFQSTDGGKTWQPVDGEYTIRLHLTQHPAQGSFASRVIDLGAWAGGIASPEEAAISAFPVTIQGLALTPDADLPKGTTVEMLARIGTTPVYEKAQWTDWQAPAALAGRSQRFLQWKAVLKTTDPKVTPVLKKVTLKAELAPTAPAAWANKVAVKGFHNESILYSSMPFAYEDPNHPRMKALREKYKLDDVVKAGKTELEKQALLRDWVGHQWRFKGPEGHYPAWDAEEILTRKTGMCCQYAMVYIQCCISMGWQARYVCGYHEGLGGSMGTAHEVTEVWNDEHAKWVFMDPTTSRNEYAADPKTGEPLSMLELHERMVKHYYGDKPAVWENRPKSGTWSGDIALVRNLDGNMQIHAEGEAAKDWPSWTKWLLTCYVPRNDWFAHPAALPRLQGWNNWDWTGFWQWCDAQTSRDVRYSSFASRRSDVGWTINQAHYAAALGPTPGEVVVQMGTQTPFFQTFLVNVGGEGWKQAGATFAWNLKPGKNRLEMRVKNTSGVEGPVSFLELEYK